MLRKPGGGLMVRTEALADTHGSILPVGCDSLRGCAPTRSTPRLKPGACARISVTRRQRRWSLLRPSQPRTWVQRWLTCSGDLSRRVPKATTRLSGLRTSQPHLLQTDAVISDFSDLGQPAPVPRGVPWYPDDPRRGQCAGCCRTSSRKRPAMPVTPTSSARVWTPPPPFRSWPPRRPGRRPRGCNPGNPMATSELIGFDPGSIAHNSRFGAALWRGAGLNVGADVERLTVGPQSGWSGLVDQSGGEDDRGGVALGHRVGYPGDGVGGGGTEVGGAHRGHQGLETRYRRSFEDPLRGGIR